MAVKGSSGRDLLSLTRFYSSSDPRSRNTIHERITMALRSQARLSLFYCN